MRLGSWAKLGQRAQKQLASRDPTKATWPSWVAFIKITGPQLYR